MGEIEIINSTLLIRAHIITYGHSANAEISEHIRHEIESLWNEPSGEIEYRNRYYRLQFQVTGEYRQQIEPIEIYQNLDPKNNYFRIEDFAAGNISFVDGLGCNSGYFLLENLYKGSTTAAHEYGHTLGLPHPEDLDLRGKGRPGMMYPRGTLVDPEFQYDPSKPAGVTGGTMHPMHRRVNEGDIKMLEKLIKRSNGIVGEFTNMFHERHERNT